MRRIDTKANRGCENVYIYESENYVEFKPTLESKRKIKDGYKNPV